MLTTIKPLAISVLLLPPVSLLCIAAIDSVLGLANSLSGQSLYKVDYYSSDGAAIALATGGHYPRLPVLHSTQTSDVLLLLAQSPPLNNDPRLILLKPLLQTAPQIGAADCGAWWLAACGGLDQHRATLSWHERSPFSARFPKVICTESLFEFDRQYFSCGAGTALLDMLLTLVGQQQGPALAGQIAEGLCLEQIRSGHTRQRTSHALQLGQRQPKLSATLQLMEANLEEPISSDELAQRAGLSRRQLERLFKQHLDILPARHYMQLRLERARTLLQCTGISLVQIGLSCGFSSGSHFSTAYRAHFGLTPRDERQSASRNPP